jgi:hypothetical protein
MGPDWARKNDLERTWAKTDTAQSVTQTSNRVHD